MVLETKLDEDEPGTDEGLFPFLECSLLHLGKVKSRDSRVAVQEETPFSEEL